MEQRAVLGLGFSNCVYLGEGDGIYFTFFKLCNDLPHLVRGIKEGNLKGP